MKTLQKRTMKGLRNVFLALLASAIGVPQAWAQWNMRWLSVGDFQHRYVGGGAQPETYDEVMFQWPGIRPQVSYMHGQAMWISVKNFTDEKGTSFPVRVSHIGPRTEGIGEFFERDLKLIGRFDAPQVRVDGVESFRRPAPLDEVDPELKADRMVYNEVNTSVGITMKIRAYQLSNEFHDDYHIVEYTFVNTGNVDDDDEVELPNQQLRDVYFTFVRRPKINAPAGSWGGSANATAWGGFVMTDAVGDGYQDYGLDASWRGHFSWLGYIPEQARFNTIGNPMWENSVGWWYTLNVDTIGRLGGAAMVGTFVLHADDAPHEAGVTRPDDPSQPRVMTYLDSDDGDLTGSNNHNNVSGMQLERQWIEQGAPVRQYSTTGCTWTGIRTIPSQAFCAWPPEDPNVQVDFVKHFAKQKSDPRIGYNSWSYAYGFGPFNMAPGQEYRVVLVEGVSGLSDELSLQLGRWYKRQVLSRGLDAADAAIFWWNPKTNQTCEEGEEGCIGMTKNEWVMTARDSLFQLVERAKAAYAAGFDVIRPPMPPRRFEVTSGVDRITISWEPYPGELPPDGWELYRAQNRYDGIPAPDDRTAYKLIAKLPPNATRYEDTDVSRGVAYYYYLQAVGEPTPIDPLAINGTPDGRPLRSSRYYAQTYDPAILKRPPGETIAKARIVPNPYIIAADQNLRWPDQQDKLGFLDIPGQCTIEIYSELGELVKRIEHTDGSGDEYWDLTTDARQVVSSGIYIAVIKDHTTGQQLIRKFVIIR